MLADSAQAVGGKLYILGGGWSIRKPEPVPVAVALKIEVPWDQANIKHTFRLILLDADGGKVKISTEKGEKDIEIKGEFETGRPPRVIPGTPLDVTLAITFSPFPLKPNSRYVFQLFINEETHDNWCLGFSTRSAKEKK